MTNYQKTKELYKQGLTLTAYRRYLLDEDSNKVSYEQFCKFFDEKTK